MVLAVLTVAGTAAAMGLRNAVHCVLALTLGFAGIAMFYLQLGAQFVGFTQILVYVGAVAILAVFAIMMTHNDKPMDAARFVVSLGSWAALLPPPSLRCLPGPSFPVRRPHRASRREPDATVQQIGDALMHRFVLPLEIMGLLLTAALIGAVVIAMDRGRR